MVDKARAQARQGDSDEELWSSYVEGGDEALRELLGRYRDELYWYLLLSTGRQQAAARHCVNVWEIVSRCRRPFEGFASFRSWLYAVATQNAVPATHPETFGLADLMEDLRRGPARSRLARVFFCIADMRRALRQPFLLVTVAKLSIAEAAKACNFTEERAAACIERACRVVSGSGLFAPGEGADEM